MCKKGFLFFALLVISFHSQAMLNQGLKNIAVKSMRSNAAAIRAMSSGKKSGAERSENYYKAGIVENCAWIGLWSATCVCIYESIKRDEAMKKSPELMEEFFESEALTGLKAGASRYLGF